MRRAVLGGIMQTDMEKRNGKASSVRNIENKSLLCFNGYSVIGIMLISLAGLGICCLASDFSLLFLGAMGIFALAGALLPSGFFINGPNEAKVVEFFGEYIGTSFGVGLRFTVPFSTKRSVSLKIESVNTSVMKVNDADGNPIEIAAAIVWRVVCPAKACFNIENYQNFISVQGETALRELAGSYPYDSNSAVSLRQNSAEISQKLRAILQSRMGIVGIEVEDARISHLAYSSEIAQVMLRRQQAKAISEARVYIVKNAVNMVDEVLSHLEAKHGIDLTDDRKLKFVSNLLVALVSESDTQPVISVE
ncbi:band 7 domain-containing protein [Anaplasma centrale str. Israel]|uniref:Band 7 domain-containing protein n=2 Tax=Anaplasma centrale TaxID=769 RepID=D1AU15_ANACI|nr:band 7 domain-containing protein [Anaplasma centrale str. Israel]